MIRRHPFLFIFFLLIFIVITGVVIKIRTSGPEALPVWVAEVNEADSLVAVVRATGEIRAHDMVDIQTEVAGVIKDIYVLDGQRVKKGDKLLQVDPFQTETELAGAQARYMAAKADVSRAEAILAGVQSSIEQVQEQINSAEIDLEEARITEKRDYAALARQKTLQDQGAVSADEFEVIEAKARISQRRVASAGSRIEQLKALLSNTRLTIDQHTAGRNAAIQNEASAKASLDRAQDLLEKATILSPLDGVIIRLNVEVGERAVPGIQSNPVATLMTIANLSVIEAEIQVDETDMPLLKLGEKSIIDVDAFPDSPLEGRVSEIALAPTLGTGQTQEGKDFTVVIAIDNPPDALRMGMSCEAEITVETRENVLTMPIQALTARELEVDEAGKYIRPPKPLASVKKGVTKSETKPENTTKSKREKKDVSGVFVISPEGFANFQPVETGIMGEVDVEVLTGLEKGQKVIIGPLKSLRELDDWKLVKEEVRDSQ